jgi:HSP20 family molecular chaperone IbpA
VQKKSVELFFDDFKLVIKGTRVRPKLKVDLAQQQQECYRGDFEQTIDLPPHVYFDRIHSAVSAENVLTITVPKSLQP